MFESPDDLIGESRFRVVAIIDLKSLTVMAKPEFFVDKVNANISIKQLTKLGWSLHII